MVLVYGMAKEQKKLIERIRQNNRPIALHLAKIFLYGKNCQPFKHWVKELNIFLKNIYRARDKEWIYAKKVLDKHFVYSEDISDILALDYKKYDVAKILLEFDTLIDILQQFILKKEILTEQQWIDLFSKLWKEKQKIDVRN